MKELNLALKELRNGAEIILLERKDPAYFQHWFEEWWIPPVSYTHLTLPTTLVV